MTNVVIVDDDKTQLMLLELLLNQIGIEPVKFTNPIKAYEHIKSHKVDVLISDYNMPEANGIELIREVKKIYPKITTAIVSAMRDDDGSLKNKCDSINTPILLKPFDTTDFIEFMNNLIKVEHNSVNCIRNSDKKCILRDKVASSYCMSCCHDDIAEEKEAIQIAVDAIDDFFPSSMMLRHVATKLSFISNIMNCSKDSELKELLYIVKQLTFVLHEYSEQILHDSDMMILISSYLTIIGEWLENSFLLEDSSEQVINYADSIRADFQTIEIALGISSVDTDVYEDLDDLFF